MKTNLPAVAVFTLALVPIVAVCGSVISGWVSDRFFKGNRYPVAMVLYFGEACVIALGTTVMALGIIGPNALGIFLGCLILILIAITANSTHSIVGAAAPMDIGGKKMAGFASGVIDSFQYYGAALGLFITGRMLDVSLPADYTVWFGIMTCFAFFGGCAMLSLLLRQKGRPLGSRVVIGFMALLVIGGMYFGTTKYGAMKPVAIDHYTQTAAAALQESDLKKAGDDAKRVLRLQADHTEAQAILDSVIERYLVDARAAMERGDAVQALNNVGDILNLQADHEAAREIRDAAHQQSITTDE
jgi:MFS family permease